MRIDLVTEGEGSGLYDEEMNTDLVSRREIKLKDGELADLLSRPA